MNYPVIARKEITHIHPRQLQSPPAGRIQPICEQYAIVPLSLLQQPRQQPEPMANRIAWLAGGALGAIAFTLLMLAVNRSQQPTPTPAATPAPTPQIIVIPQQQPEQSGRCIFFCFGG